MQPRHFIADVVDIIIVAVIISNNFFVTYKLGIAMVARWL
jgi:hypothetical protein